MTTTAHRPPDLAKAPSRRPDPLRAGIPAALWAFAVALVVVAVPVLLGWAADSGSASSAAAAAAAAGQAFLLAHGAGLSVPGGQIDLVPLGLTLVPALLLVRAGRHAAALHPSAGLAEAGRLTLAIALPYATLATALAAAAGTDSVAPAPVQALVGAGLLAGLAAGFGVVQGAHLGPAVLAALPERLVRAARGALAALAGLLAAGAVLVALSLALHAGRAAELAEVTSPGLVGGLLLLVIGLLFVPVAAVWGACWWIGPGFAVGAGTAVGPFGTELGPLPALPLLAALPAEPVPGWVGVLALLVPVGLGLLAGLVVQRHQGGLLDAALVGPLVGAAMALLCALTAGPVGGARLVEVGPSWPAIAGVVTVQVGASACTMVAARRWRAGRAQT